MKLETRTVTLGEKEYTIPEAGHRRAKGWKTAFIEQLYEPLQAQLVEMNQVVQMKSIDVADLPSLSPFVTSLLTDTIDTVLELVITYSKDLEEDRDTIEETASDRQIIAAFWEVLKLANPLSPEMLTRLIGLYQIGMSESSPLPNGDSGPKSRTNSRPVKSPD